MYHDSSGSRFVRHGPCEACGSRDNVGWYSNGTGYCFGCGRFYKGGVETVAESAQETLRQLSTDLSVKGIRPLPDDLNFDYGDAVIQWIKKYDLRVEDLIRNNVKWSQRREQLFYIFYGRDEEVLLWQARNFRSGTPHQQRFFTSGTPDDVIAAYPPGQSEGEIGVIVEDCISALKLGKSGFIGLPCFSANLSARKLARISKRFDHLVWWLDADKFKEAQKQRDRTALLGVQAHVIYTELDPKEYSLSAINKYVNRKVFGENATQ